MVSGERKTVANRKFSVDSGFRTREAVLMAFHEGFLLKAMDHACEKSGCSSSVMFEYLLEQLGLLMRALP